MGWIKSGDESPHSQRLFPALLLVSAVLTRLCRKIVLAIEHLNKSLRLGRAVYTALLFLLESCDTRSGGKPPSQPERLFLIQFLLLRLFVQSVLASGRAAPRTDQQITQLIRCDARHAHQHPGVLQVMIGNVELIG